MVRQSLRVLSHIGIVSLSLLTMPLGDPPSAATLEFKEADTLPRIGNMFFTPTKIGLLSQDGRVFVLDRNTDMIEQLDVSVFDRLFPEPRPPAPFEKRQSIEVLRSTTGAEFEQIPAYCGEGVQEAHQLRHRQGVFVDVLKPCTSVAAVEILNNQVWLGTVQHGEGGPITAEGVVVQSLQGKKPDARITTTTGLTSDHIQMIRYDSFSKLIWIATEGGLNQVDRRFKVVWKRYWHEDFDKASGKSRTILIETQKTSNPWAILSRELAVHEWDSFSQVVARIPSEVQIRRLLYELHMIGFPPKTLPQEMNELLPFFLNAAQSADPATHDFGLRNLCRFNDRRVQAYMTRLASQDLSQSSDQTYVQECLKAWPTQSQ